MADKTLDNPSPAPNGFEHFLHAGLARLRRFDRVAMASVAIVAVIAVIDAARLREILAFTGTSLAEIAPVLLLSVGLAAYLKASGADGLIAHAFSGGLYKATFLAAVIGAFSPFCSCGVVPLVAALLASGVPLAPVMAFWLASPVMDPQMFVVTAGVLGAEFAIAKSLAAVGLGLLGGGVMLALQNSRFLADPLIGAAACCSAKSTAKGQAVTWKFWGQAEKRKAFTQELGATGWFLTKWMAIAFLLEAIMVAYVPMQELGGWIASAGSLMVPTAAIIGVPAYLNGYAAIPLTDALMDVGLTASAAMTFMVAGAVTSIPAAVAVKALVRFPIFLLYIVLALVGSTAAGFVYAAYQFVM